MEVNFSREQQNCMLYVLKKLAEKELDIRIGGYAGTGKSTIVSYFRKVRPDFHFCAYTGKAAEVLRKKGLPATTIHSLIYEPEVTDDGVEFRLKDHLDCGGIIVDEASMVSKEIYEDLITFRKPIVFVGDHGQLEPVGSEYNLMQNPHVTLEEIHRNSGEIARFAEWIRHGRSPSSFRSKENKVEFLNKWSLGTSEITNLLCEVDQVICAFNSTRVEINDRVRSHLGHKGILVPGDRIICLRNDNRLGLFNGMQGIVRKIWKKDSQHKMSFDYDGTIYDNISYLPEQFGKERLIEGLDRDGPIPFDYAHCITCHKSQGSEIGNTLVIEQKCKKWNHQRWGYTAASRAKNHLWWMFA